MPYFVIVPHTVQRQAKLMGENEYLASNSLEPVEPEKVRVREHASRQD